ncbi:MAG: HAD family hydrolase, partial [Deltaproteobacteria bacterium]
MQSIWPYLEGKTHIIWDWNGTILNDVDLMVEVIGNVLEDHGLERVNRQSYLELFRFPVKEYYKSLGFNFEKESFEKLSEKFTAGYRQGLLTSRLHEGMKDFLFEIKSANICQSVLSAAQEDYLKEQLKQYEIDHCFDHVYGIKDF